ncbi:hypothetical protein, partial [Paraburkholderia hospita]|uniref:hypothetical protein n=1 Tax=Paraburkholderia hospita TaxID=169430 RepID=UPI001A97D887
KKSRCRPAQGQRLNGKYRNADASAKGKHPDRRRIKHEDKTPDASDKTSKPPSVADNQRQIAQPPR